VARSAGEVFDRGSAALSLFPSAGAASMPFFAFYSTLVHLLPFLPCPAAGAAGFFRFAQTKTIFFVENARIFVDLNDCRAFHDVL
jgi:hypothetical protein